MKELLTTDEARVAALHGWMLCDMYDHEKRRPFYTVLPCPLPESGDCKQALRNVVAMAEAGDPICLKALGIVAKSFSPNSRRKEKRK
jgi:hypothetical protein